MTTTSEVREAHWRALAHAGYTASQGDRQLRPLWQWTIAGLREEGCPIATIAAGAGLTRGAVWQSIRAARAITTEGVAHV